MRSSRQLEVARLERMLIYGRIPHDASRRGQGVEPPARVRDHGPAGVGTPCSPRTDRCTVPLGRKRCRCVTSALVSCHRVAASKRSCVSPVTMEIKAMCAPSGDHRGWFAHSHRSAGTARRVVSGISQSCIQLRPRYEL